MHGTPRLFLIGPMGAGKTAIGKELARQLELDFLDADQEIERRTGVDIPLIFDKEGEAGFRRREREVIAELTQRPALVLATGGGAVLDPANREALKSRGCVIYLRASLEAQAARTAQNRHRPLLHTEDRESRLKQLFEMRRPLYEGLADVTIDTDSGQVKQITQRIIKELERQDADSR
ncbi:MAG TPA: shikimate kinase AroK [Gammaproteobacteria bacterium]|nr:shikimate kinase AroK [Gammaproteobacteria bacterium]